MEKLLCLYCPTKLGPKTLVAHVMSSALGGLKKSRRTACDVCNRALSPVEGVLAADLREFTGPLGIVQGSGDLAPAAIVDHPELGRLQIADGVIKRQKVSPKEVAPGRIEIGAGDLEIGAEQLAHQLRRYRRTPDDLASGRVPLEIRDELVPPGRSMPLQLSAKKRSIDESSQK